MTAANGWNAVELRDNRYNHIVHMVSAANGAEDFYSTEVNIKYKTVVFPPPIDRHHLIVRPATHSLFWWAFERCDDPLLTHLFLLFFSITGACMPLRGCWIGPRTGLQIGGGLDWPSLFRCYWQFNRFWDQNQSYAWKCLSKIGHRYWRSFVAHIAQIEIFGYDQQHFYTLRNPLCVCCVCISFSFLLTHFSRFVRVWDTSHIE